MMGTVVIYVYVIVVVVITSSIDGFMPSLSSLSSLSPLSPNRHLNTALLSSNNALTRDVMKMEKSNSIVSLLIDNYDSYTYNIYQLLTEINGLPPIVIYNNDFDANWNNAVQKLPHFDNIVISPGPGSPDNPKDFGLCKDAILLANVPVFGVCLGHQGIAHAYGGNVVKAPYPMHGRLSSITHQEKGLFEAIDQHTRVVRYHSLVAQSPLPSDLEATAWTEDGVIMALQHRTRPVYGVQFHPESISTACGRTMFNNFKRITIGLQSTPTAISSRDRVLAVDPYIAMKGAEKGKHVSVMRVSANVSSEVLFEDLYGGHPASFWLDSATANTATANKASISFFGAIDTPSSTIIEYADHNSLFIRSCNGSTAIEKNIFEYLDDTLEAYKEHEVHVEYSNFDLPKDQRLPFNLTGGVFGYLGYELRSETTHILTHSSSSSGDGRKYDYGSTRSSAFKRNKWVGRLQHPLALFMAPSRYIVYDHSLSLIYVVACADERTDATDAANDLLAKVNSINSKNRRSSTLSKAVVPSPLPSANEKDLTSDKSYLDYYRAVDVCQEHIQMGESYELCLTAQFHGDIDQQHTHLDHYKYLRSRNPAPFSCFLHYDANRFLQEYASVDINKASASLRWMKKGGFSICSSSPERFLSATEEGFIESKPIKGTVRRNLLDSDDDRVVAENLSKDEKSRAENLMIVDLLRNDFGRICLPGTVCVPKLMDVETYASVHQLVSTIRGRLNPQRTVVDALIATFPGGSMTGAPKIRTMDIIDELEGRPRGIYSGALGYIGFNGAIDLNIVIRTAVLENSTMTVGAGGAIVAMSDVNKEIDEVLLKARAVSAAFDRDVKWL